MNQNKNKKYMINYCVERRDGHIDKYDNGNGEIVEALMPAAAIEMFFYNVFKRECNDYLPLAVRTDDDDVSFGVLTAIEIKETCTWTVEKKYFNFSVYSVDEIPLGEKVEEMLFENNVRWDDEDWCNKVVSMFAQWCNQEGWYANTVECNRELRDLYNSNLRKQYECEDWNKGYARRERELDSFKNFICKNVPVNDIYGRQVTVDLKNKKLVSFDCKKEESRFNAEITENGKGTGVYTDYIEPNANLVWYDINKKLAATQSPIQMFYTTWLSKTFATPENADPKKKAYKALLKYVKENEKDFFYKNGNFRRLNNDLRARLTEVANDGGKKEEEMKKYFWTPAEDEEDDW